jgi:hypothetical protein
VIKGNEQGLSERKLAEKFKCSKTQVNGIVKKPTAAFEGLGTECKPRRKTEKAGEVHRREPVCVKSCFCAQERKTFRLVDQCSRQRQLK